MANPTRYRRKPVDVEAIQLTAENVREVAQWLMEHGGGTAGLDVHAFGPIDDRCLVIGTLEGDMRASLGDYVIRGVDGEFYPCKPHIFHKIYDRVIAPEDIDSPRV